MTINMRADRINRGLSQLELADRIGVSVDVVRNVEETGNRPRPANALAIANFYECTVLELWPGSERDRSAAA